MERKSRSQLKREASALVDLAEELIALSAEALSQLELDMELEGAVLECKTLKKGARSRQLRRIAKLLRSRDTQPMTTALDLAAEAQRGRAVRERELEALRTRLLEGGDRVLQDFLDEYPKADRNQLRALIRSALRSTSEATKKRAQRELLRLLRRSALHAKRTL